MKKKLSILLAIVLMFVSPMQASAQEQQYFSDMPNNWSTEALTKAVTQGLMSGYNGKIYPEKNLTRAEMAAVINRVLGAKESVDISSYTDVKPTDWFYGEMSKAVGIGTFHGYVNQLRPNEPITREEVFSVLSSILRLKAEKANLVFTDSIEVSSWAQESINGMINGGYISGSNGKLNPKANITRAEFAQVMHNIIKDYINTATAYEEINAGNIIVNTPNATLKNVTVRGDLIIAEGVGEGEVTLDNVKVEGRMLVRAGGENSIIIKGDSEIDTIVIVKQGNKVRIFNETGKEIAVATVEGTSDVILEGKFKNVVVQSTNITVYAQNTEIEIVEINGTRSKVIVGEDSKIEKIDVKAANVVIEGKGAVKEVEVKAGGTGTVIITPDSQINVENGANDVTGTGEVEIKSNVTYVNGKIVTQAAKPLVQQTSSDGSTSTSTTTAIKRYTVNYSVVGSNGTLTGTVTNGNSVNSGTSVTFTVSPSTGYEIKEWKINGVVVESENTLTRTISANTTVTVEFKEIEVAPTMYTVTYSVIGEGGTIEATVPNGGTVLAGSSVDFTAVPEEGYKLKEWTVNGEVIDWLTGLQVSRDMNMDVEFKVEFEPIEVPNPVFDGGDGSEEDPYQVATATQLNEVRNYLEGHFIQTADINLGVSPWNDAEGWEPIGNWDSETRFKGSYNGNDFKINNLTINNPDRTNLGLFGVVGHYTTSSEIKNITLTNISIAGESLHSVGALAGIVDSTVSIDNCHSDGIISSESLSGYAIGGLIGSNSSTLINSSSSVNVLLTMLPDSYNNKIGGLAGHNGGSIDNCFATGNVTGKEYVGGLLGWHSNNPLTNSYSMGNVSGGESVGGLIGLAWGSTEECFSTGTVSGNTFVGGLIGNLPGVVTNSYTLSNPSGSSNVGGLVGFFSGGGSPGEIVNCYSGGNISGDLNLGGLVASVWSSSSGHVIESSYWDTQTSGLNTSSGGTGYVTSAMIKETNGVPIYENWNFDTIWTIQEGQTYPYLQWQGSENIPYPPSPFAGGSGTEADPYQIATAEQLDQVRNYLDKHFIQTADINLGVAPWNEGEGWEPIGDYVGEASFKGEYDGDNFTIDGLYINRPAKHSVGLFGELTDGAVVKNLKVVNVDVTGNSFVGAVSGGWGGVGYEDSSVINVHVSGITRGTDNVGGLVGTNSTIMQSSSTANVHGSFAGGLVGLNREGHSIVQSYATGLITGTYTGGLVGHNNYGTIQDSYSLAQVKGDGSQNGGVIGVGYHFNSVLSNVFAAGIVDSGGGLIGVNHNGGTDYELTSYWDKEVTGQIASANSDANFGKTTSEMKTLSTFVDWDFSVVWGINPDENSGYPFLRWQGIDHVEP